MSTVSWLLLLCAACIAQTAYQQLMPGKSNRADVERALGGAIRSLSNTLSEYRSNKPTEQIFVQYTRDSDIVARIEVTSSEAVDRANVLRSLNLSSQSSGWQINSKGRLEEYFFTSCIVLTYVSADTSRGVARIGYYSSDLFVSAGARGSLNPGPPPSGVDNADSQRPGSSGSIAHSGGSDNANAQPAKPKYEDIVARASAALDAHDFQNAIRLSQQAVDIDPSRAQAFEIEGIAQLYGIKDLGAAANTMRAAVSRGGSASFFVTHDHDGVFQAYCQGSFYVSKQGVRYSANDGKHSFYIARDQLKDAGLNNFVGANLYSFHIKVIDNNKTRTYNFATGTFSAAEANLILELLKNS